MCGSSARVMAAMFPHNFEKEFEAILNGKLVPNIKLKKCKDLMIEQKIMYSLKKVNPKLFVVHKANGLGLHPFNAHKGAAKIYRVGADRKLLTNALGMELAPVGNPFRDEQIEFNKRLIDRSQKLLAQINGL